MKALASSQLAFELVLVPSLGLAFQESLLCLFFTELERSSSRQKMEEATRKHGVRAERMQRGEIRTLALWRPEKSAWSSESYLSNLGFPSTFPISTFHML